MASISTATLETHLTEVLERARRTGCVVQVLLQDDPEGDYRLERATAAAQGWVDLSYRCSNSGGMYSATVSMDRNQVEHVRLTPGGCKGRDFDGELIEVRLGKARRGD